MVIRTVNESIPVMTPSDSIVSQDFRIAEDFMARAVSDISAAAVVSLLAFAFSFYLYSGLQAKQQAAQVFHGSLPGEEVYYRIEQNSRCVGYLKVASFEQELFGLAISGALRVAIQDRIAAIGLKGENYFNPLGQLVRASYELEESKNRLSFASSGVDQIVVNISWELGGLKSGHFSSALSGPVLFQQSSSGKFTVTTPWSVPSEYTELSHSFISRLGLVVKETSQLLARCEGADAEALRLNDSVNELKRVYPKIGNLLEAGGNG